MPQLCIAFGFKTVITFLPTGVVYITYSKTSEAALAMEEMNGKILPGNPRPLKVHYAAKHFNLISSLRKIQRMVNPVRAFP